MFSRSPMLKLAEKLFPGHSAWSSRCAIIAVAVPLVPSPQLVIGRYDVRVGEENASEPMFSVESQ